MIKALIYDIDGTLIARNSPIVTPSAKEAIIKAHENGYRIVIATGRGYYAMNEDVKYNLPYDCLVTINGGCTVSGKGEIIRSTLMDEEETERLINELVANDYPFAFKFADCYKVYNRYDDFTEKYCVNGIKKEWLLDDTVNRNYHKLSAMPVGCFMYSPENAAYELREHYPKTKFVIADPKTGCCECFSNAINKGKALREAVADFGLTLDECMAFGDSQNDLEMLKMCGIGVAMGNASEDVRSQADYVTADINDDGIAKAMKHFGII